MTSSEDDRRVLAAWAAWAVWAVWAADCAERTQPLFEAHALIRDLRALISGA